MTNDAALFELEMGEDWTEVNMVSFVPNPAIRSQFMKFNEDQNPFRFQEIEDQQIVTGPVLIPDLIIPRKLNKKDGTAVFFNVVFRAEQIRAIYDKFMATESYKNTNLLHKKEHSASDKCHLFETFMSDKERGIQAPVGFEDHPDKTWYMSYKITDLELWAEIKAGKINGYSIEGNFRMVVPEDSKEDEKILDALDELAEILK